MGFIEYVLHKNKHWRNSYRNFSVHTFMRVHVIVVNTKAQTADIT